MILPGSTLGVLGGGQLGRMFCMAARSMGYRTVVLDPDGAASPAAAVADHCIEAVFTDTVALRKMAGLCDAVTIEFENVPLSALDVIAEHKPVYPAATAVQVAQHRIREKDFATQAGLMPAPYASIATEEDFDSAIEKIGFPAILKTTTLGYDGKGQRVVSSGTELERAFTDLGNTEAVLEGKIDIQCEVSVLLARNAQGDTACYPLAENLHRHGILHQSIVPARVSVELSEKAIEQATMLAKALDYVGVIAVEFFVTTDNNLIFNEMAPRPHNTGHYTLDASQHSQFQQQVRALCGLTLGDTELLCPAVMVNLLGDIWPVDWAKCLETPTVKLHLYGKEEARAGRKMGHYTVLGNDIEWVISEADGVFSRLSGS